MATQFERTWAKLFFTEGKRLSIYRRISSLIRNGTNVDDTIAYLYKRASKNGTKPGEPDAVIFNDWLGKIRNGKPFSTAIADWSPSSERMIIAAGEKSGMLPDTLSAVCDVVESNKRMKKAVLTSLIRPLILAAAAVGVIMLFGIKVIPMFAMVSKPQTWELSAYALYLASQFVTSNWLYVLLAAIAAGFIGVIYSLPRLTGPVRVFLDKIPPYSTYRLWVGSGFILSLAAMIKSGEPIQRSMQELMKTASPYLRERLKAGLDGLKMGNNLGISLEKAGHDFPDREVIEELVIYSNQSGFDAALEIIGREWLEKGAKVVEAQAAILNVLATLLMGGVVIWIVIATFSLQNSFSDSISRMSQGV
jgi:type II secretory pathway component PulF